MKIYGNEKTNLQLSEKAAAMYAQCDPLTITEHDDGTYSLSGVEDRDNMTADDVNQWLEDLADDCGEEEQTMMTIEEIVASMMDGSPDYDKPMTLEVAREDVRNLQIDAQSNGEELPEDLTPERYAEIWNDLLRGRRS